MHVFWDFLQTLKEASSPVSSLASSTESGASETLQTARHHNSKQGCHWGRGGGKKKEGGSKHGLFSQISPAESDSLLSLLLCSGTW